MITEKQFNQFKTKYNKNIHKATYRRYKDKGFTDIQIAERDLDINSKYKYRDTMSARCRAFNEKHGLEINNILYRNRINEGYKEEHILKYGTSKIILDKLNLLEKKTKLEEVKPIIALHNINIGGDDYYKRFAIS